jgi:hypothetical protein
MLCSVAGIEDPTGFPGIFLENYGNEELPLFK